MDLEQVIARRRMVRRFDPARPPLRVTIDRLLDLARRGPSAGHTQGWHFLVLDNPTACQSFWSATTDPGAPADVWLTGLRTAPVLVLVLTSEAAYRERRVETGNEQAGGSTEFAAPWWWIDAGMATHTLLLGAVDKGLGACLFGVPPERAAAVHTTFAIPTRWSLLGVVALGYPAERDRRSPPTRRGRRPWSEVVSFGQFGGGSST